MHGLDAEAGLLPDRLEHGEVALARLAEAERRRSGGAYAEAVDQHVLDELLGGELGEAC